MIQTVFEAFRGAGRCFKGISPPDRGSRFVSESQSEKSFGHKAGIRSLETEFAS
jgi:hypothetical protein